MPLIDRDTDLEAWFETHTSKSDPKLSTLVSWKTHRPLAMTTVKGYAEAVQALLKAYPKLTSEFKNTRLVAHAVENRLKEPTVEKKAYSQKAVIDAILWNIGDLDPTGKGIGKNTKQGEWLVRTRQEKWDQVRKDEQNTETEKTVPWTYLKELYKMYPEGSQDRAILAVYTLFPPRRLNDYCTMKVMTGDIRKPPSAEVVGKNNILLLGAYNNATKEFKKGMFIFGDYKTEHSYGVQYFPVPDDLFNVLQPIAKAGLPLFRTPKTNAVLACSTFSKLVGSLSADKLTPEFAGEYAGRHPTPTIWRHSFISHFLEGNPTTPQRKDVAKKMAHTIGTQLTYDERKPGNIGAAYCPCAWNDKD